METTISTSTDWSQLTQDMGNLFADRAEQHDKNGSFVFENYKNLKTHRFFSAAIPEVLGGEGLAFEEVCNLIRSLAQNCASTALAFSMHQHLVAAAVWRFKQRGESAPLLQRVANEQLVLISTGAKDWLDSNGEMIKTEGGYFVTAKKYFASQSVAGDLVITSAPYQHPENGWQVLHFSVPMKAEGVSLLDDWDVLGMRATGSQTIAFDRVFVPDSAITLTRPRNGFHPVWDVVITVAMPLIMSVYVGIAEKAMEIAISLGKKYPRNQKHLPYIVGKMNNSLVSARAQWKAMISITDNFNFKPAQPATIEMLSLKTNVANACKETVKQAMEAIGVDISAILTPISVMLTPLRF